MAYFQKYKRIFDPLDREPYRISRSKIELFTNCPRCFYLDQRFGIKQPGGFPFTLNNAVDFLLKKEFDAHREKKQAHPLMKHYGVEAVPFNHEKMNDWRDPFKGIEYFHEKTNFKVFGGVDDIWVDNQGQLIVVDYKATSTNTEITLESEYRQAYKRQVEIYQWLLRGNGFEVSDMTYFVYANGRKDVEAFDAKLKFDVKIMPYRGDDSWVEKSLIALRECLMSENMPPPKQDCDFCNYRKLAERIEAPQVVSIQKGQKGKKLKQKTLL